jgi:hypothetical protein
MKKIFSRVMAAAFVFCLWSAAALAANGPVGAMNNVFVSSLEVSNVQGQIVGTAKIYNASQSSFQDIGYKYFLFDKKDLEQSRYYDQSSSAERFMVEGGKTIEKPVAYQLPVNLPSGEYVFRFQLIDSQGKWLGFEDYEFSVSEASSAKALTVDPENSKIFINGDEGHHWGEGPTVKDGDKVEIAFKAKNENTVPISNASVELSIYEYSEQGEKVYSGTLESFSLVAGASKDFRYKLPKLNNPNSYLAIIRISQNGSQIAPLIQGRWVIDGYQGKIASFSVDKEGKIKIEVVGSPLNKEAMASLKLLTKYNEEPCSSQTASVADFSGSTQIVDFLPDSKDGRCVGNKAELELKIGDQILDSKTFDLQEGRASSSAATKTGYVDVFKKGMIVFIIFLLVTIAALFVYYFWKHRKLSISLFFLTLIIFSVFFFGIKADFARAQENPNKTGNYGARYGWLYGGNDPWTSKSCNAIAKGIPETTWFVEPWVKKCECFDGKSYEFSGEGKYYLDAYAYCGKEVCKNLSDRTFEHGGFKYVYFSVSGEFAQIQYLVYPQYDNGYQTGYECVPKTCDCGSGDSYSYDNSFGRVVCSSTGTIYGDDSKIKNYCINKCSSKQYMCKATECECEDGYKEKINENFLVACSGDAEIIGDASKAINYCREKVCRTPQMFNEENYFKSIDFVPHKTASDLENFEKCLDDNKSNCFIGHLEGCDGGNHRTYSLYELNWAKPIPDEEFNVGESIVGKVASADWSCFNGYSEDIGITFKIYRDSDGSLAVEKQGAIPRSDKNLSIDLGTLPAGKYTIYVEARMGFGFLYHGMYRHITVAGCGDGKVQSGEQCDEGSLNGSCPAVCSATCTLNSCPKVDASCGPAAKDYAHSASAFSGSLCNPAELQSDPSVVSFPANEGENVSWKCLGGGNPKGTDSQDCWAKRDSCDLRNKCEGEIPECTTENCGENEIDYGPCKQFKVCKGEPDSFIGNVDDSLCANSCKKTCSCLNAKGYVETNP